MDNKEGISRLTGRFVSEETEAEYQDFVFERNLSTNKIGIALGVTLFALYSVLDIFNLVYPTHAILVRLACAALGYSFLVAIANFPSAARLHEVFTAIIVTVVGLVINFIIWIEPSLDNAYYVGLIQVAVVLSFLLRMRFVLSTGALFCIFVTFVIAVHNKPDQKEALLQIVVILTMFTLCTFGMYLLERYRRIDFLKTRLIERQNAQLKRMLEDVRLDNARKVAALNTLVHFVRTPIHQISGFTDVVMNALSQAAEEKGALPPDCLKSVGYIKNASNELAGNVAKLLAYYRLDESSVQGKPAPVPLYEMARDFKEEIAPDIECAFSGEKIEIMNHIEPIRIALSSLAQAYNEKAGTISRLDIALSQTPDGAAIVIVDDGPGHTPEEFCELAKPLTKLDRYLTSDGSAMPMAVRTAARAAEVCGGALTYEPAPGANRLTLRLKDLTADLARADEPEPEPESLDESGEAATPLPAVGAL